MTNMQEFWINHKTNEKNKAEEAVFESDFHFCETNGCATVYKVLQTLQGVDLNPGPEVALKT